MDLKIKNLELIRVINLLDGLDLAGLKGIYRTKLSVKLQQSLNDVIKTEQQLRKELKDDVPKLNKDLISLQEDYTIIDGGDSLTMLESVKSTINDILKEEKVSFDGEDAYAIATLYEAFNIDAE